MHFKLRVFPIALAALFIALPAGAAKPPAIPALTPDGITHHRLALGGRTLAYTARAGTITLRNGDDQPIARVFYTAYTLDGADPSKRAVTFIYNGGPGSSTMWLRMGSFGPVRVQTGDGQPTGPPPYRIVDNRYSLLDKTDMVFIDMPGSGFGRIIGAGKRDDLWGVDEDVAAFGQFIQRYITRFNRWNSPRFLFGESYGTTRSAVLAKYLQDEGIGLNGVVLLSSFLNSNIDYNDGAPIGGGDWGFILYLPTEAATAWYHHAVPDAPALTALLSEVENFALTEYLDVLAQGARATPARYNDVVAKLHRYTGLSERYIRSSDLRIPYDRFENELLRESGRTVGRIDSRFETYVLDRPEVSPDWDATDAAIDSVFTSMSNYYLRQVLHYNTPLLYRANIYAFNLWRRPELGLQTRSQRSDPQRNARPGADDDVQSQLEGFFRERIFRFRNALLRNGLRTRSSLSGAGNPAKYYLRLLRLGAHGLSSSRSARALPRRLRTLVRGGAAKCLAS